MEKSKNLYVGPMDMKWEGLLEGGCVQGGRGSRGEKNWDNCNSIINKVYFNKKNCTQFPRHSFHLIEFC